MRAVIISDSHGDVRACEKAIEAVGKADMIIHLGDMSRDASYIQNAYPDIPLYSVMGNNEPFRSGETEETVMLDGFRLFICHGHTFGVHHGTQRVETAARHEKCDAVLFGHTHRAVFEKKEDGLLVINPGSVSYPRNGDASFAVLETDTGTLEGVIVDWVL